MNIQPVILAGGVGSRLWPLSREWYPKQFLSLQGKSTLIQDSLLRAKEVSDLNPIIITNSEYKFFVADQVKELGIEAKIILEPFGRNTAPAISIASFLSNNESVMMVLSSDSFIEDNLKFFEAVKVGYELSSDNFLVTFGVSPNNPNTGYGYIKKGKKYKNSSYKVDKFLEKPGYEKALEYVESGNYLWNCGIFMFKAHEIQNEISIIDHDLYQKTEKIVKNLKNDMGFYSINSSDFSSFPNISIDNCIYEHTSKAAVVPLSTKWDDLGSWKSIRDIHTKDKFGNSLIAKSVISSTKNSLLYSKDRLIATHGLDDVAIIDSKDSILVTKIDDPNGIKNIVSQLKDNEFIEALHDKEVHRPWGKYESLYESPVCQVKIITVNPQQKLSVQSHKYRSEHWIVIKGKAIVQNGDDEFELKENESTYIHVGTIHSLANIQDEPLEIIEIQTGTYFGEDDIVRYDDIYGRNQN
jgi:mannose-1-phosphate guanylyltransferase